MEEKVMVLENLVKDFNGKRAVDNFSLNLRKGEILGLLGPNGAGKTTTIRMIMNIIAPDSGSITILGKKFSEKLPSSVARPVPGLGQGLPDSCQEIYGRAK